MSKRMELQGQRFGNLTAIRPVGKNACGQMLWECACVCGRTTVSAASMLKRGTTRSCGCLARQRHDLSGQAFGKLTAIQRVVTSDAARSRSRSAIWLCRCECGRETSIRANALVTGNTKSCGYCSFGRYESVGNHVIGYFENNSFLIDVDDYDQVSKYRWWIDKGTGYFCTNINGHIVYLHRFLLTDRTGLVCDHRNRDKCDNRRANLRYATPQQNSWNRSLGRNNTSGYIGVCWHVRQKKYVASINVNNRTINLGSFHTAEEAACVRDKAAQHYFGSFANLNFGGNHEQEDTSARQSVHAARLTV